MLLLKLKMNFMKLSHFIRIFCSNFVLNQHYVKIVLVIKGKNSMDRKELIDLVSKIKNCEGTEEEIDNMIVLLEENVIYPDISDLIFYNEKSAEEIVDIALAYKPIKL